MTKLSGEAFSSMMRMPQNPNYLYRYCITVWCTKIMPVRVYNAHLLELISREQYCGSG